MKSILILIALVLFISTNIFATTLDRDLRLLKETTNLLLPLMDHFREDIAPLVNKVKENPKYKMSLSESDTLSEFWTTYHDVRMTLGVLHSSYSKEQNSGDASFLRYLSALLLQNSAAEIVKTVWDNPLMRERLDIMNRKEVPQGTYHSMENEVFKSKLDDKSASLPVVTFLEIADVKTAQENFNQNEFDKDISSVVLELEPILKDQEALHVTLSPFVNDSGNHLTLGFRNLDYKFNKIYYKLFSKISTWIGDTKVKRTNPELHYGDTYITKDMANKFLDKLNPGDLVVSRGNWFLSNIFMVGFWPHSTIYLGNSSKLKSAFDNDQQVKDYFTKLCKKEAIVCYNLTTYLEASKKTRAAWSQYLTPDKHGEERVMIEATSDGVILSTVYEYMADFLAGMRPVLAPLDKARAIVEAFKRFGLPYDFDFNLLNEDRLVCSALVDKSFSAEPLYGKQGIHFDTNYSTTLGRLVLPPNNIVHKAYEENVLQSRAKELTFVAFLRGYKLLNNANFTTEKVFYESRLWPKWSFMQE